VPTRPRSPRDHYTERLLAAAEASVAENIEVVSAPIAIAHAVLATVTPRRAPRREQPAGHGGSPQQRWLYGDDEGADR
jgi:hypothetical protein